MKKFEYKISFLLTCLILLMCAESFAQRPPKALLGITAGAMILPGGNGTMFESSTEQAHRTWGWAAGASLYRYLRRDLHLNFSALVMEEQSHVHPPASLDVGMPDIPFAYRALHTSLTLNHQGANLRRPWVLKEFAGFGFNIGNLLSDPVATRFGQSVVRTSRTQNWRFDPEFIIGVGMVSKMSEWGNIHYTLSLHMDLLENQLYEASVRRDGELPITIVRAQRDINIMLTATYFIRVPNKDKGCYQ